MMSVCTTAALSEASLAPGFCAGLIPLTVAQPRSIIAMGTSDFLTVERGTGSVLLGEDTNSDGIPDKLRTLVTVSGLNHGLSVTSTHLYASKSTEVYRWPFDSSSYNVTGAQETVITNMNADGRGGAPFGHTTRTLAIQKDGSELYVSVGSNENVDPDSFRARIRRFNVSDSTLFPLDFLKGEVFADGLRNEVALDFHPVDGTLWGVGNSADTLFRADLGGDIHQDNPAEEVHRFGSAGLNFGYPFCWREFNMLLGKGRGTEWAWPDPLGNRLSKQVSDEQCRSDYDKPVLALQGHSAPLGITFYQYNNGTRPAQCNGVTPFPPEMNGFAFVAYHGSWNRAVPTGFKVVYFKLTADGKGVEGGISSTPQDLLVHEGTSAKWSDGFRPVDVSFDACGRLLLSSDGSRSLNGNWEGDKIVRIEATQKSLAPSPAPKPNRLGDGLIVEFFAGIWARIRKWFDLYRNA